MLYKTILTLSTCAVAGLAMIRLGRTVMLRRTPRRDVTPPSVHLFV